MNARARTISLIALLVIGALATRAVAATPPPRADLVAQRIATKPAPASVATGSTSASWTFNVANSGKVTSKAFNGAVYLSRDAIRGKGDVLLGKTFVRAIAVRGSRVVVVKLVVPATTAVGSYRLIACALPAFRQTQVSTRNDCVAAATLTAVKAPTETTPPPPPPPPPTGSNPPAAPTLTSVSEGGRGTTLRPSAHGTGTPVGAVVSAYDSPTCAGTAINSVTSEIDGSFDVPVTADIAWGATVTFSARVTTADGTSGCSNAITYTHRGVTYTWNGAGWTGPATIPVDSLVRIINSPDAIQHFTKWASSTTIPSGTHGNVSTPGTRYDMPALSPGQYAWYNHASSTAHTGSFTAVA